jgi:hypothetical protein
MLRILSAEAWVPLTRLLAPGGFGRRHITAG